MSEHINKRAKLSNGTVTITDEQTINDSHYTSDSDSDGVQGGAKSYNNTLLLHQQTLPLHQTIDKTIDINTA